MRSCTWLFPSTFSARRVEVQAVPHLRTTDLLNSRQNKMVVLSCGYVIFHVMEHAVRQVVQAKFVALKPLLDERTRRRWAAVEARATWRRVAEATGMSKTTVGGT